MRRENLCPFLEKFPIALKALLWGRALFNDMILVQCRKVRAHLIVWNNQQLLAFFLVFMAPGLTWSHTH